MGVCAQRNGEIFTTLNQRLTLDTARFAGKNIAYRMNIIIRYYSVIRFPLRIHLEQTFKLQKRYVFAYSCLITFARTHRKCAWHSVFRRSDTASSCRVQLKLVSRFVTYTFYKFYGW